MVTAPLVDCAVPELRTTAPLLPESEAPDATLTRPLEPEAVVPVLSRREPLTPVDAALAVRTTTAPEEEDVLEPLTTATVPPVAEAVVLPPNR